MPRTRTRTRHKPTRAEHIRAGVLIAAAVLIGAGIIAVDLGADTSVVPEVASWVDPGSSDALTSMAQATANDDLDVANGYAIAALRHNPLDDDALVIAALSRTSINQIAQADALFELITTLTRRQSLAETWMFDLSVGRGDYAGAIDHADAALRRQGGTDPDVLPVLVRVTNTSAALPALARKLVTMPPWRTAFFRALSDSKTANALALLDALHQAGGGATPTEVGAMASQQIAAGSVANARLVWQNGFGSPLPPLLSPNFESMTQYGDFGWTFGVRGGAQIVARSAGRGHALEVEPSNTGKRPLRVLQQAMLLERGRHVISFEGRSVDGTPSVAAVSVHCAGTDEERGRAPVPAARRWALASFTFIVPVTDCPIQKLVIEAVPNLTQSGSPTLIDNIQVE